MHQYNKIYTYFLENPLVWIEQETKVQQAFLKTIGAGHFGPGNHILFKINPVSGWIYFERKDQLRSVFKKPGILKRAEEAKNAAAKFLQRLAKISSQEEFGKNGIPPLVPSGSKVRIKHVATRLVPHPKHPWLDHWLVNFSVHLKKNSHNDDFLEMDGSGFEIRIGNGEQVIGFHSKWRPSFLKCIEEDLVLWQKEEGETAEAHSHGEHDHGEAEKEISIVYESGGENVIQNSILPYHREVVDGHHFTYAPACKTAFMIRVENIYNDQENNEIAFMADGGSGDFRYAVYSWKPDEIFDRGCEKLISGSMGKEGIVFELPKAIYNLIFWIADVKTGVIKKLEHTVYSMPITGTESSTQQIVA